MPDWLGWIAPVVSIVGALVAVFSPGLLEKRRHKYAQENLRRQQEHALANIREQHQLQAKLSAETWLREQRSALYGQWQENSMRIGNLLSSNENAETEAERQLLNLKFVEALHKQLKVFGHLQTMATPEVAYVMSLNINVYTSAREKFENTREIAKANRMLTALSVHMTMFMGLDLGTVPLYEDAKQADMTHQIDAMIEKYLSDFAKRSAAKGTTTD